jgi:hypothetical protein
MPILGVVASSTRQGLVTDTGAVFALGSVIVGSSNQSYIEFTSIPQTYKHLQIRAFGLFSSQPTGFASGLTYLNGDTTNGNYKSHHLVGDGSVTAYNYSVPYNPIGTGATGYPASYVIDILDYTSTTKNTTIRSIGGWDSNGGGQSVLTSVLWLNTAAVNAVRIQCDGGYSWMANTAIALYGIKG